MKNCKFYLPRIALRKLIKSFLIIESDFEMDIKMLPATNLSISFTVSGGVEQVTTEKKTDLPASILTSITKQVNAYRFSGKTITVLATFRETGAAAFFKEPLHLFSGTTTRLDTIFNSQAIREVEEKLVEAGADVKRIAVVEDFLIKRLKNNHEDSIIQEAVTEINKSHGILPIKAVIADLPLSRDAFEKRFRRITGTTPKHFASIVRLRNLVRNYQEATNLTDLTFQAGYFDQSHFIRDFKAFTGQTPKKYFSNMRIIPASNSIAYGNGA